MNEIITIQLHHHVGGVLATSSYKHEFYNFKVVSIKPITDRQRINFNHKMDNQTGNMSELDFVWAELKPLIQQIQAKGDLNGSNSI